MARNYTMQEVARIIRVGVDKATLIDIGKKFPLTMFELAKLDEAGLLFAMKLPTKLTARKFEMELRGEVEELDDEATEDENAEVASEMPEPRSWKSMSQYQKTKARALGAEYVAACKKLDAAEETEEDKEAKESKPAKKAAKAKKATEEVDEEEEEEVKPKKAAKKEKKEEKKPAKKSKKVVEEEDDDDFDDFDFDDEDDE